MNTKESLTYWLNSRHGYYDPAVLNRLQKNQLAFNNYIVECEKAYQAAMKELIKEEANKLRTLNEELKSFLERELWPMILRSAGGDLEKAKAIIRQDPCRTIVRKYNLQESINKQYQQCKTA